MSTPAIPAPPRTAFRAAWIREAWTWITTQAGYDRSIYLHYADNNPEKPELFDEHVHRKYNASVYFRQTLPAGAAGDSALKRGLSAKWACDHASRSPQAQQAYEDFLRGLEVAGAQETIHFDGSHVGKDIPEPEREGLLRELLGQRYVGNSEDTKKELLLAAEWERLVQLRRDAPLRRRWVCRMQRRARQPLMNLPEPGEYPPIRYNTYKMLVR
jgi:hypothetical protein